MRTIKFRFTYTDGKNWIKQDFTLAEIMNGAPFDVLSDQPLLKNYRMKDSYQFTGLTDKNGVEICEGDVLDNGEIVVFSQGAFMTSIGALCLSANHREIIGNIYQNFELLKK